MDNLKNIIFVEGETEKKFFEDFRDNLKHQARIVVHNVAQNDFKTNITGIKYNIVSVVLDIDIFTDKNLKRINSNLKSLNASKINIYIQNRNFEDELIRSLDECNTVVDLYNLFGCKDKSANEFKRKFLNVSNLSNKNKFVVDFHKLYCENYDFKTAFQKGHLQTGKHLFKKMKI